MSKKKIVHFTARKDSDVIKHLNDLGIGKTDLIGLFQRGNRLWAVYWGEVDPMHREPRKVPVKEQPKPEDEELEEDDYEDDEEEYEEDEDEK